MNFIVASFDKYSSITVFSYVCTTVSLYTCLFAFAVVTFDGKLRVALYYNVHVSVPLRHCASVQSSLGLTNSQICTCGGL